MRELLPASLLADDELRRELVETHQLAGAIGDRCAPALRDALHARLADLDDEYLRRFSAAEARWPWPRRAGRWDWAEAGAR